MTTYDYSAGTMIFEECWFSFGLVGDIVFLDTEDEAFDAFDFEADIEATHDGLWRLSEIRAIKPGTSRKAYEILRGKFKDKAELYISQRWHDRINDRVICEVKQVTP